MIQVIDYFKIASKLNEITGYSLLGGIILLWMWTVMLLSSEENSKKTFWIFSCLIVFSIG